MSSKTIPLDKVHSEIAKINLSPKLEGLLNHFSEWCSYENQDWGFEFLDSISGTELGTLYTFLIENDIWIRPSGFEFYLIEEDSGSTEESEQSNCSDDYGRK